MVESFWKLLFHNSGRLWLMFSRKHPKTFKQYSLLTVCLVGLNLWLAKHSSTLLSKVFVTAKLFVRNFLMNLAKWNSTELIPKTWTKYLCRLCDYYYFFVLLTEMHGNHCSACNATNACITYENIWAYGYVFRCYVCINLFKWADECECIYYVRLLSVLINIQNACIYK